MLQPTSARGAQRNSCNGAPPPAARRHRRSRPSRGRRRRDRRTRSLPCRPPRRRRDSGPPMPSGSVRNFHAPFSEISPSSGLIVPNRSRVLARRSRASRVPTTMLRALASAPLRTMPPAPARYRAPPPDPLCPDSLLCHESSSLLGPVATLSRPPTAVHRNCCQQHIQHIQCVDQESTTHENGTTRPRRGATRQPHPESTEFAEETAPMANRRSRPPYRPSVTAKVLPRCVLHV